MAMRCCSWTGGPAPTSPTTATTSTRTGPVDPIVPGHVGCFVIHPDGSRYLAHAVPDPLAE
jgi:hypothetical protein